MEYRLEYGHIKHKKSRAAMIKLFRNPTMATVSSFTYSYSLFNMLHETIYVIHINSLKSITLCHTRLANPNNLHDNDYTCFFYPNDAAWIDFLLPQPPFWEQISCSPAMEYHYANESIY